MTNRLFLHVGLPKSGTTYLQAVLGENKQRLVDRAGLLYPGKNWAAQVRAARDVLEANPGGHVSPDVEGSWARLMAEVHDFPGDAVVSMEWLGSASPEQAARIADTVSPSQLDVVVTIRDLARTIPAAWQEFVQNMDEWSWPEFVSSVTSESPRGTPAGNLFWLQQDIGRLLAIWSDVVPAERIHIVTLPPPGAPASELWVRFASVLGVDGDRYDASGRGSNESLGLQSAELMRRLNVMARAKGLDWPTYDDMFKHALAKRGLSKRKDREGVLRLPSELDGWAREQSARMVSTITASGAHVVGDLADLSPARLDEPVGLPEIGADELLDAALEGLVSLARDRQHEIDGLRRAKAEMAAEISRLRKVGGRTRDRAASGLAGARSSLVDASQNRPWVMALRQRYRRVRDRLRQG